MTKTIIAALALTLSLPAFGRQIVEQDDATFTALTQGLDPSVVYFAKPKEPSKFADWVASSPAEAEFLSLWSGYQEPLYPSIKGDGTVQKKLRVYVGKAKALINKPAASMDLKKMINLEFIANLTKDIRHQQFEPSQSMPRTSGRGPVRAFAWCNASKQIFVRHTNEGDLSMLLPPSGRQWCENTERSICVESCYEFDKLWEGGIALYNLSLASDEDRASKLKEAGLATQSEFSYYLNEGEMGVSRSAKELTGINSPLTGVIRQNIFYASQAIQFATVTAFFQPDPADANKTIVTSYFVFAVGENTWSMQGGMVRDVLMGESSNLNTQSGITAGLPIFTKAIASAIAAELDK